MEKTKRTSDGYLASPSKPQRRKPEFSITEKDLPAIKEWKVGKKYSIELNVEMVSSSKGSDYDAPYGSDSKDIHSARFKILSIDNEEGAKEASN